MKLVKKLALSIFGPFLTKGQLVELSKPLAQRKFEREVKPVAVQFFGPMIPEGALVFDVGAHSGMLSDIFLACGARVVAVEPQPWLVVELRARFAGQAVDIVECAVADTPGSEVLNIDDTGAAATLSADFPEVLRKSQISQWFRDRRYEKQIEVKTTTLDALIGQFGIPQFCKIDVEGFEHKVLAGLSEPIPTLSLEYTGEDLRPVLSALDILERLGSYRYNYTKLGQYHFDLSEWCDGATIRATLHGLSETVATGDVYASLSLRNE